MSEEMRARKRATKWSTGWVTEDDCEERERERGVEIREEGLWGEAGWPVDDRNMEAEKRGESDVVLFQRGERVRSGRREGMEAAGKERRSLTPNHGLTETGSGCGWI